MQINSVPQKHSVVAIFSLANTLIILISTDCPFLIIVSYVLNPNLVLNSVAAGTVEYI